MNKKNLVIGLGNILLRDEGVGVRCVEHLKSQNLNENIKLVDGGTMGFNLLEEIEGFEKVVIVDAVDMGKEPGHIASFKAEQVLSLPSGKTFSLHELGLSEVLQIGAQLGYDLSRTTIVGIQPQDMSRGDGLTDSVQGRFPDLVEKVLAEINN